MIGSEIQSAFKYRWKIGLLAFITVLVTGLLLYVTRPVVYEARMQLAVEQPSQEIFAITQGGAVPVRYLSLYTRASRIHTPSFAKQVAEAIALETPGIHLREEEIHKNLHAFTNESPDLFVIYSENKDQTIASNIAKTAASIFVEERKELVRREAKAAREKLQLRIDDFEKLNRKEDLSLIQALKIKLEELRLIEETRPADVVLLDEIPQVKKITLNIFHELLLLSLLGVTLGTITMFIGDSFDSKITRLAALRAVSGNLPCWIVPKVYGGGGKLQSFLKAICFWQAKRGEQGDNKTKSLLIVPFHSSVNNYSTTEIFTRALPDLLKSRTVQNIAILSPEEILKNNQTKICFDCDLTIIVSPPLEKEETAYRLASFSDGVLLTLETGQVSRDDVVDEIKRWRELSPPLLGLLLLEQ